MKFTINKICFFCFLLFGQTISFGQINPDETTLSEEEIAILEAEIFVKIYARGDSVLINWIPMKPEGWKASLSHGFQIIRKSLDSEGNLQSGGQKTIIGANYPNQLRPKNATWFQQNATLEGSLVGLIGNVLYDEEMNIGKDGGNNDTERYKLMVMAAEKSDLVGEALGWYFLDTSVKAGENYEYTIQSLDASGQVLISQTVAISNDNGNYEKGPRGFVLHPELSGEEDGEAFVTDVDLEQIVMSALPKGDSVVLRWAPNSPEFWDACNNAGYLINRVTIDQETGQIAENPETKVFVDLVAEDFLMPWDSARFMANRNEKDSMVMVAAQVLYGTTMNIQKGNFIDENSDLQNRYAFAMLAAERSARAADALGLRFVDKEVQKGKSYRYQIASLADPLMVSYYTLYVENTKAVAEAPQFFTAKPGDKAIQLSWSKDYNKRKYSTYRLERSEDGGKTYEKLSLSPLLYIEEDNSENLEFTYVDSVIQNYKTYHYRLYGLNSFAEWSAPAEVNLHARDYTPPPNPYIISLEEKGNGEVKIAWDIEQEPSDMAGYKVQLGQTDDGFFTPLFDNPLPPGTKEYTYRTDTLRTDISYYFQIAALDTAGNQSNSFASFLNVVDSIAPAPPVGLLGVIDTLGVVTIGWKMGDEPDLAGYRVFFANQSDYEFTQLTVSPTENNFFLDTIEIKTLTEEIYYKIQAVDGRHNRGEFSEVLKLQKPDMLPPTTPVLRQPIVSADSIILNWIPSVSEDVESHILYRKKYKSGDDWEILATLTATDTTFSDTTAETEQLYEYTLRAQDDADLFSEYAFIHKARKWFDGDIIAIQNLQLTQDTTSKKHIKIVWDFTPPTDGFLSGEDYRFYLYKSKGEAPLERYKQLKSPIREFLDTNVSQKAQYNYAIKVVFVNGKTSPLSEMVSMDK